MSKSLENKIYNYCQSYNKYETFVKNQSNKKQEFIGYLIESDLIRAWKLKIYYEKLSSGIADGSNFNKLKTLIEKNIKTEINPKIERTITQTKFTNSTELLNNLNNNKEYILITFELWNDICKTSCLQEEGIKCIYLNKNISLIFNNGEKLRFKIDENDFKINKSKLIEKETEKYNEIKLNSIKDNQINEINYSSNNNEINEGEIELKYKKEVIILIKLYYYEKNFKSKIKEMPTTLKDENKFYLISNNWLSEFKNTFLYCDIKTYIKNKEEETKISEEKISIEEMASNKELIHKLNDIKKIENMKNLNKYDISTKKLSINKEVNYLTNFYLIDKEIFDLLISEKCIENKDDIKQCELYKLEEKYLLKIIQEDYEFKDELGYFNENNNFTAEYLLEFNENYDYKNIDYNEIKIKWNDNIGKNIFKIINISKSEIGFCYYINGEIEIKKEEKQIEENEDNKINKIADINLNEIKKEENIVQKNHETDKGETHEDKNDINHEITHNEISEKKFLANIEKEVDILVSIYYFHKQLKENLMNDKIIKSKGFIISQNWLNTFKSFYSYGKVCEFLEKKNIKENDNKIKEILKEIFNDFNEEELNNKIKDERNLLTNKTILNKNSITDDKKQISYPACFYIINDITYNKFKSILAYEKIFDKIESKYFYINNGKIILNYESFENLDDYIECIVVIAKINEDNSFTPELLLNYNEIKIQDNKNTFFENIFSVKNTKYTLESEETEIEINKKNVGKVYKLNTAENKPKINNNLSNKIKIQIGEKEQDNNNNKNMINNEKDVNGINKEINIKNGKDENGILINGEKEEKSPKDKEQNIETDKIFSNDETPAQNCPIMQNKNNLSNNKSNINSQENLQELSMSTKKDIFALIKYHQFKLDFINKIEKSKKDNNESNNLSLDIYLVNENWMSKIKNFYEYENLTEIIEKNKDISIMNIENILRELNILEKYRDKEKNKISELKSIKREKNEPNYEIKNIASDKDISYPKDFEIINEEIFINIIENNDNLKGIKYPCIINSGKIIIRYEKKEKSIYILIIGNIDANNCKFIPELILNYNDNNRLNYHFEKLLKEKYEIFINECSSEDKKDLFADKNQDNILFGSILMLNPNNNINKQIINYHEQKNPMSNNENIIKILNQNKIRHIKFLLSLNFLYERLDYQINDSLEEKTYQHKYYLIKNEIINKYKELYLYDELLKNLKKPEIQNLINDFKNKANILYIPEFQMNQLLGNLIKFIDREYAEKIKQTQISKYLGNLDYKIDKKLYRDNQELFYYEDCQLINEEMMKLIIEDNDNEKEVLNQSRVNCLLGEKVAFLVFNNLVNIGKINHIHVFKPEVIIKLKKEDSFNLIINQIKQLDFNLFKESLRISQINLIVKKPLDYEVFIISQENDFLEQSISKTLKKPKIGTPGIDNNQPSRSIPRYKSPIINKSLQNLIFYYMDYLQLKSNSENSLIENYKKNLFDNYYLLNYGFFLKYLEVHNLTKIYQKLMALNIKNEIGDYENLSLDDKIEKILQKVLEWDENINNSNDKYIENMIKLKQINDHELINLKSNYIKYSDNYFKYNYDFILMKYEIYEAFIKDLRLSYKNSNYCLFGDKSIFIYLDNDTKITLQVGHISTHNYYFSTDYFFDFFSKKDFNDGFDLLTKYGLKNFISSFLIFNNQLDYTSPIFNENKKIIGYTFLYNRTNAKINYEDYFINNNLKNLILFYLENEVLRKTIYTKDINKFRNYYLVSEEWLNEYKKFYNYPILLNEFIKSASLNDVKNNIKPDDKLSFTEKRLCRLVKELPLNLNINLNKKKNNFINNCQEEPNYAIYQYKNDNHLLYYNNFEIISEDIYNKFFGSNLRLNRQKNNYVKCLFYEGFIMIELSPNVSNINDYAIEIGKLNNNIFTPFYISIYKDKNKFVKHMQDLNNPGFSISYFYTNLIFNKGCSLDLYDQQNNIIGTIYNLNIKFQDIKPNNNNNINNINIDNNHFNINNINHQNKKKINFPNNNNLPQRNIPPLIPNNNFQINNNNNRPQTGNEKINYIFTRPPLIGLKNVGATCYMNATLQCFSQIDSLVNYFKYKPYIEEVIHKYDSKNKLCLTESFKELMENLWPTNNHYQDNYNIKQNSNNKYYAPYNFKKKISDMNDLFKGVQANDSKDLVNFIIMTLHEELNRAVKNRVNNDNFVNNIQTDKKVVLFNFIKSFQEENMSIISDLFYGQSNTMTQCLNCKEIKYNFQTYFFLIFPLEEVRKFNIECKKNYFIQNNAYLQNANPIAFQQMLSNFIISIQNQNYVNIYDCFNFNQKIEYFNGANAMYCNRCQAQHTASYFTKLYTGPEILIIILNRGVGIQFKIKLEFSQELNLTRYIEAQNTGCLYNLIGVVTHMGESGASGHFIAYCKSPIDTNWYRYNDDIVSQVYDFKKEIIDYAMPYILFFKKVKNN